ncbi:MAG: T9SS type A sorting domain-containing protein [Bacteroidetes bacterium]|nr:T9SS type A sorting domain-containing protein [Bacteroidota bacterium]
MKNILFTSAISFLLFFGKSDNSFSQTIAAGRGHTLALCSDNSVQAWGNSWFGQVGDDTIIDRWSPVDVMSPANYGITALAAGWSHSLALKNNGTLLTWGNNQYGQLGDNTITDRWTPVFVHGQNDIGLLSGIVAIAGGYGHSIALKNDGTVWTWGRNDYGQLGDNTLNSSYVPVQVHGPADVGFLSGIIAVTAGWYHCLALKNDGTVWSWGWNDNGQLGDSTKISKSVPVQIVGAGNMGFLSGIIGIAAGRVNSFALKNDGTVWSLGWNNYGQLGDNTLNEQWVPVQMHGAGNIGFLTGITKIASGRSHFLALKNDGTVWACGWNTYGQLGDNSMTDGITPVQVRGPGNAGFLTGITEIIGGGIHSFAVKNDGTRWIWGDNTYGQIGDNSTTKRLTPVQPAGLCSSSTTDVSQTQENNWELFFNNLVTGEELQGTLFLSEDTKLRIEILDLNGRRIKEESIQGIRGINKLNIDLAHAASGIYLLRISGAEKQVIVKFVKASAK